jgi:hypothetical protein
MRRWRVSFAASRSTGYVLRQRVRASASPQILQKEVVVLVTVQYENSQGFSEMSRRELAPVVAA